VIPNGLLKYRVENIENHLGKASGYLERMSVTYLINRVSDDRVVGTMKRGRPKKLGNEVLKEGMKKRS